MLMLTLGGCGSDDGRSVGDGTGGGDPGAAAKGVMRPAAGLQGLAERYATDMDPDQLETTYREFAALNASELDTFNEASEKVEASKLDALYLTSDGTKPCVAPLKEQLRVATTMRKEINRLSMAQYGKPYNQIDSAQLDQLFPLLKGDYSTLGIAAGASEPSLTAPAAACDAGNYPLRAQMSGPTWRLGTGWSTYYENRINGQSDCDLVYAYRGTFTRIRTMQPKDVTLMGMLGGGTAMRHTGYSDIVLGTGKVWLVYGHPSLVTLRMY
jgi:hypothetical protein